MLATFAPVTLPIQAWGPQPLVWHDHPMPVWVWVSWPHRVAERYPGVVKGSNDRVCVVEVNPDVFTRWEPVVWRNAVTRRTPSERDQGQEISPGDAPR